jgi:hypothetical protein
MSYHPAFALARKAAKSSSYRRKREAEPMKKQRFVSSRMYWLDQKTRWRKHIQATFVLTIYAMFVMLGGCE